MLLSASRSADDFSGVFEFDGETAYFYLWRHRPQQVVSAIHVVSGKLPFVESEARIVWNTDEKKVGLVIRDQLWAVFDVSTGRADGGNYQEGARPPLLEFG